MTRFLCTGDLHLGAGSDLGNEPGERLAEQEAVLDWIVSQANDLDATLIFAGDAWERRRPTPAELLAFKRPLENLRYDPVGITGNHDVEAFERPTGYDLAEPDFATTPRVLSPSIGVSIACLPWAPPARLVALEGGGDRDSINVRLAEGLLEIARGLFAQMRDDRARILVAHWSVGGASTPTGVPVELFREPVLDLRALEAIGFDAVVLGHIHKPQMLSAGPLVENEIGSHVTAKPTPIFYVGSPMPLNFGEAESAHVVWLLDVDLEGRRDAVHRLNVQAFQIPVPSRRLVTLTIDDPQPETSYAGPSVVRDAIVKVKLRATEDQARRLDVAALRQTILEDGAHKVWSIQTEIEKPELTRGVAIDETVDDEHAFRLWLDATGGLDEQADDLFDRHLNYLQEVQR